MKRVTQRKARQNLYGGSSDAVDTSKKQKRASQDIGNKTRTSAAMLGLALSMGASGSLLSCHKAAVAAESDSVGISSVESGVRLSEHIIREGETLWTVAKQYNVSSASLAALNSLDAGVVLRVGQTIKVPSQLLTSSPPVDLSSPEPVVESVEPEKGVDEQKYKRTESLTEGNLAQLQVQDLSATSTSSATSTEAVEVTVAQGAVSLGAIQEPVVTKAVDEKGMDAAALPLSPTASEPIVLGNLVSEEVVSDALGDVVPEEVIANSERIEVTLDNVVNPVDHDRRSETSTPSSISTMGVTREIVEKVALTPSDDSGAIAFSDVSETVVEESSSALGDVPAVQPSSSGIHQIRAGETLATIARRYGVSTQQLIDANRIYNPNRIFAGQVLNLPAEAVSVVAVVPETANNDYYVIPDVPDAVDTPVDQIDSMGSFESQPTVPQVRQPVDGSFYVRQLLDEIEEMADAYGEGRSPKAGEYSELATEPEFLHGPSTPTEVAYAPEIDASAASTPLRQPRFEQSTSIPTGSIPTESTGIQIQEVTTQGDQVQEIQRSTQLIASVPLGSENYVPLNQPVTGRMVSPDLPPLTGPDNYLPEGVESFNGYLYPAQGTLTSGYGWRWGRMHRGIDVAAPVGTPIVAAAPGVVEFSGWSSGGYGNMVEVRHPDGSMTRYAHNSRNFVRVGQQVSQGERIAAMGSTGYSTGPHVHFEIHLPNQGAVNPVAYLVR